MASAHRLATTIPAHAFNGDGSMLAICPNTTEVWIFTGTRDPDSSTWVRAFTLRQHSSLVSAIDWHAGTNRIVTCSHDRSAFVWAWDGAAWAPQVVVLQHRMACLDVKWSPDGRKFAVASGAKKAFVCFFEPSNNWWVAKETRKHKSTVLALAWHPSGLALATVSTDYTARVFSARLDEVDGTGAGAGAAAHPFGELPDAGELVTEFEVTRAWLNDVAWSPAGGALAFVGHDSLLHVVTFAAPAGGGAAPAAPTLQTIKCQTLPATRLLFLSDAALVTVGHSLNPELYTRAADGLWRFAAYVDRRAEAAAAKATSGVAAARAMFASKTSKGQSAPAASEVELWTKHQNAIVSVKGYRHSGAFVRAARCAKGPTTDPPVPPTPLHSRGRQGLFHVGKRRPRLHLGPRRVRAGARFSSAVTQLNIV